MKILARAPLSSDTSQLTYKYWGLSTLQQVDKEDTTVGAAV